LTNRDPQNDFVARFKAEIAKNVRSMYRYAYVLCRDKYLAQDIAHDACVNIFKSDNAIAALEGSEPGVNPAAYSLAAVANAFRDYQRAPGKRTGRSEVALPEDEGHRIFRVGDRAEATVTSLDVESALMQLDDDERAVIFLRYYEGRGIADAVQAAMGVPEDRAYRRHRQLLRKLRQLLEQQSGGE
jgi:RNA polymerase sigma factor (sigma-70 family)